MKPIRFFQITIIVLLIFPMICGAAAAAADTGNTVSVYAAGRNANWDGVTNVAQFAGPDGCLYYAVDSDEYVTVYKTKNGAPAAGTVKLKKQHSLLGTVICDNDGYYYVVTGEVNSTNDTSVETIFISKYDSAGKHIKTVGDNGRSSLGTYHNNTYNTKLPFDGGNCDAAISGKVLTVHYAREMYSAHQSDSVFTVNTGDMTKINVGVFYSSHSFAQRVVPTNNGFAYISEGDSYDRTFCLYSVRLSDNKYVFSKSDNIFDFWIKEGAHDAHDMYTVNNNFAHMGGLAALSDGNVAFAAQSAKSLSSKAQSESEEIFIQIFDPSKPLNDPASYVTSGTRSGLAGQKGTTKVTNYGVKWLTSYGSDAAVQNVQISAAGNNRFVVLYELTRDSYEGVWYIVLDNSGNVISPAKVFEPDARLNPCEMPVYAEGKISWVGNRYGDISGKLYLYQLPVENDKSKQVSGDVNGDGNILADDARLALRYSARLEQLAAGQIKAADVDNSGDVLADDARHILRASAKLEDPSTWGKPQEQTDTDRAEPAKDPTSRPGQNDDPIGDYEREAIRLINAERTKRGLRALSENKTLSAIARQRSQNLFDNKKSANGDLGNTITKAGIAWNNLREGVITGPRTPEKLAAYLTESTEENTGFLSDGLKQIGVGFCAQGNIWTMILLA